MSEHGFPAKQIGLTRATLVTFKSSVRTTDEVPISFVILDGVHDYE